MEKVTHQVDSVQVYENDIVMYLDMFCEEQRIDNMRQESQSVWNAALMYINKRVFKGTDKLKDKSKILGEDAFLSSTFNRYNYDTVSDICDMYIYLCSIYDKEISIIGFSRLTGIDTDTINEWGYNNNKLSTSTSVIYKKLYKGREESLSNKLATGNKNPVGILAILNRHYSWNLPGVSKETANSAKLSVAELPKLSGNGAQLSLPSAENDV